MKLASLILSLGLFGVQGLQAADICTPLEVEHPGIKERARIVHLPGGHSITLLGHVHGERDALKSFSKWAQEPAKELSNDQWREQLHGFVKNNEKTLSHVKQDLGFLRAMLWETRKPLFVAVESRDADVAGHLERAGKLRSALSQVFWAREQNDTALLRDAQLITMGAPLYSYLHDVELRDKYQLIGMEGTEVGVELQKQGKEKMRLAEVRLAGIKEKKGLDQDIVDKAMALVVGDMNEQYSDIANILAYDHEMIRTQLMDKYPYLDPDTRGTVLFYLYGYLDYLRGMKKRDLFFARKLAAQKRSGVFFFGEEHLISIAKLIELECGQIKLGKPIPENQEQPVIEEM